MVIWKQCPLGDIIRLKRGYDLPNRARVSGQFPVVSSSGITDFHKEAKVSAPGVITGRCGTLGDVFYIKQDFWPLNTSLYVQDFKGNNPRFISYFLKTLGLGSQNAAGAVPGVNRNALHQLVVQVPDVGVQKKIAAVLSAYDDLIENNNRRIALLEKMAEEIYREWFVRLRFPGHEQVVFHKGIPEGWEDKRFDKFCLLQRGYDLPNAKVVPGIYPVIASTSIKTYHNQCKIQPPVITTGRSGSLGTVLYVNSPAWPLNTTLFVKNTFGNSAYFIYYTLKLLKLENFNSGAGVPTLNRNHLGGIKISVPPKTLQSKFDDNIEPIFQQLRSLQKANNLLQQTRDRLLPRLISGKLSVEDLDIQFPPSMGPD